MPNKLKKVKKTIIFINGWKYTDLPDFLKNKIESELGLLTIPLKFWT